MDTLLRYRGRTVNRAEVHFIRELIAAHPGASRRALSQSLCAAWNWRQPNGQMRDMICRGLMLALARAGHIELPAHKRRPPNPFTTRGRAEGFQIDDTALTTSLRELAPLSFRSVRRTPEERCFNALLQRYHYLGYSQPVGEQLKFMVYAGERAVALFAWSSAARHLGPRDRYLGWCAQARRQNIQGIAYNTRYLILPWVRVPHLASHLLAQMTRQLSAHWQSAYGHPVYFAETFIDPTRYRGTCYRAANWVSLGTTQGRGKADQTHRPNRTLKEVLGLALSKHFREQLLRVNE